MIAAAFDRVHNLLARTCFDISQRQRHRLPNQSGDLEIPLLFVNDRLVVVRHAKNLVIRRDKEPSFSQGCRFLMTPPLGFALADRAMAQRPRRAGLERPKLTKTPEAASGLHYLVRESSVSKRWVKARYVAERHEIAERYDRWEIIGPLEIRKRGGEWPRSIPTRTRRLTIPKIRRRSRLTILRPGSRHRKSSHPRRRRTCTRSSASWPSIPTPVHHMVRAGATVQTGGGRRAVVAAGGARRNRGDRVSLADVLRDLSPGRAT